MPDDPEELIQRLRKEADDRPWQVLGRFTWDGPRPNTQPIHIKGLDRAESNDTRCQAMGWESPWVDWQPMGMGGPPTEIRCVRHAGHDGSHYGDPERLVLKPGWWQVWAWD